MAKLNQVEQLKLNVTNIHSFLVKSNKDKKKLNTEKKNREKRKLSFEKQKEEEEKLKLKIKSKESSEKLETSAVSSGNILDKILNFGGLLLAGILVNGLPTIIDKVKEIVDSVVNFLTPIQSGFNLIKAFFTGEIDESKYDVDKKRFDDGIESISGDGGLIDQLAEKAGPLGGLIKLLKPVVDKFKQTKGKIQLSKQGDKEGFVNTETGEFTEKQFTSAEREKFEKTSATTSAVKKTERGSGMSSFREDAAENTELQKSVRGQSTSPTSSAPDLKTAIRRAESGNDYGATFRAYLDGFSRRNEDITNMSINQVVKYQKDYIAHQRRLGIPETQRSAAVGAYQMLYPEVAASKTGVPLTAKFSKENQDRMADYYLNMAGYQQFINGRITAEQFNDRLAGQFASLKTTSGRGVYDTDGINKAYEDLLDLIKKSKPQPKITPAPNNKGDQARVLNQKDPRKKKNSTIIAVQRVNTKQIVPLLTPVPVKSKSSLSVSQPQLSPLWA